MTNGKNFKNFCRENYQRVKLKSKFCIQTDKHTHIEMFRLSFFLKKQQKLLFYFSISRSHHLMHISSLSVCISANRRIVSEKQFSFHFLHYSLSLDIISKLCALDSVFGNIWDQVQRNRRGTTFRLFFFKI